MSEHELVEDVTSPASHDTVPAARTHDSFGELPTRWILGEEDVCAPGPPPMAGDVEPDRTQDVASVDGPAPTQASGDGIDLEAIDEVLLDCAPQEHNAADDEAVGEPLEGDPGEGADPVPTLGVRASVDGEHDGDRLDRLAQALGVPLTRAVHAEEPDDVAIPQLCGHRDANSAAAQPAKDTEPDAATSSKITTPAPSTQSRTPPTFALFRRRSARSSGRKLEQHVVDTFAGRGAAAHKFHAALATAEATDSTGAVGAYRRELGELLGELPTLPLTQVHTVLRESGVAGRLRAMDEEPSASGAIGQVHRAEWTDGSLVAVKLMRPGVWERLPADLGELLAQAHTIGRHLPDHHAKVTLRHLAAHVAMDLDFNGEAARQHAFYSAFTAPLVAPHDAVSVPRVRLVAPTVLITDWVEAEPLETAAATLSPAARARAAQAVANFAVTGMVETGMVHGDLHPGNVFVSADGTLTPVDFAVCVAAPVRLPDAASALVRAARTQDAELALRAWRDLGLVTSRSPTKPAEALAQAVALAGPLDHDAVRFDDGTLAELAQVAAHLRGLPVAVPLEATLRALSSAAALCSRLRAPVDVTSALRKLPGLERA